MLHRMLVLTLTLLLLYSAALAVPIELEDPSLLPETTENGFLPEGGDPVFFRDFKGGYWIYVSDCERIEITRHQTTEKPLRCYYIADIRLAPGMSLFVKSASEAYPGSYDMSMEQQTKRDHIVYAQNGDYYSYRVKHSAYPGQIVRDGKVIHNRSFSKPLNHLPNLASMGLYPDGTVEVNESWEKTAEQYVAGGAESVVAFGPILIRDGEIPDLTGMQVFRYKEPRSCLGWIEPGHYIGLLVEGRRDHSVGANMTTCAELLKEQGCVQAINLDGGGSATMLFMGESVQISDKGKRVPSQRHMPDVIGAGVYE